MPTNAVAPTASNWPATMARKFVSLLLWIAVELRDDEDVARPDKVEGASTWTLAATELVCSAKSF
jgi:hypothetical protein